MSLQDQLIDQYLRNATPEELRKLLPTIFQKGSPQQFQAVIDCVLTEAKRRQTRNGTPDQTLIR